MGLKLALHIGAGCEDLADFSGCERFFLNSFYATSRSTSEPGRPGKPDNHFCLSNIPLACDDRLFSGTSPRDYEKGLAGFDSGEALADVLASKRSI
jgi:hypothetical protein